jgi:hypothetical protein
MTSYQDLQASSCKYALLGAESEANIRLSDILKQIHGEENFSRFLYPKHLQPFIESNIDSPIIICVDLLSLDLSEAIDTIAFTRDNYPKVVFNLYVDKEEYARREEELPRDWQERFRRYFKTYKEDCHIEYEPIVRASLRPSEMEAMYNMKHEPIRMTSTFDRGVVQPKGTVSDSPHTAFISYSRRDWDRFVAGLVSNLRENSQKVWIDQSYVVGGDDWMDAIGQALHHCDTLLLVLSPNALSSRYVKMEYRYFFSQGKPIVPVLYEQIPQMPFELATLHYIDFTRGAHQDSLQTLLRVLARHRGFGGSL